MQSACAVLCHLWSVRLYNIFLHYLINGTIFLGAGGVEWGGGVTDHKIVLIFSPLSEIFLIKRSILRDIVINVFVQSTRYSCQILIFFPLALQPIVVVFYSPLAGFSLLACEVS